MSSSAARSDVRRTPLPGSGRDPLPGARDAGAWPGVDRAEVSVLLRRGSRADDFPSAESLGAPLSERLPYLRRTDFARRHSARADDVEMVTRFAEQGHLAIDSVNLAARVVKLSGTVDHLARAFGTELRRFEHPSSSYRGHLGPIQLPSELVGPVLAVLGLDNRPQLRPHFRRNVDPQAVGYSVPSVGSAYDFPTNLTGSGQCIGILEFGGGFSQKDLETYFESLGRPLPELVTVNVDGAANSPTGDPNGPDAEVELDVEIAGALAPGAKVVVYFAPNTDQGFVDALATAVHDAANQPSVLSISWGGPEDSWAPQSRSAFETVAQDGAVQGVTILAASGDQGASDGEPPGTLAVDFPASSLYAVGCGGTHLVLSGGTIVSESVWNDLAQGLGASGGGVSEQFARPGYQAGAAVPRAPNGYAGRGVPDVAGDADPDTGYSLFVDGASAVIGGTSAVAPLWAGLLALLAQGLGKPLGYANPLLYSGGASRTFRDITSGNNGGYSAGPGWDACTGLGTPRGSQLLEALTA